MKPPARVWQQKIVNYNFLGGQGRQGSRPMLIFYTSISDWPLPFPQQRFFPGKIWSWKIFSDFVFVLSLNSKFANKQTQFCSSCVDKNLVVSLLISSLVQPRLYLIRQLCSSVLVSIKTCQFINTDFNAQTQRLAGNWHGNIQTL